MKLATFMAALLVSGALTGAANVASASTTFAFQFDEEVPELANTSLSASPSDIPPPIVGTGTFTIGNDPGDGLTPLTDVGDFSATFDIGGDLFATGDIATPISEVLLSITGAPGSEQLQFSNNNPSGFGSGPQAGSIDFDNSLGQFLSFEPPGAGGLNEYIEDGTTSYFGIYEADELPSGAPEPSTWALMLAGIGGIGLAFRHAKRKHGSAFARALSA